MARVVRVLEYLGEEEVLRTWLYHSLTDGVSPMFGPNRQLTITTIESNVPGIEADAGKGRPLTLYESYAKQFKEEVAALIEALTYYLKRWPNEEHNPALERVLNRLKRLNLE